METGKVMGYASLASILAVQGLLSSRPLFATITNLGISSFCLSGYLGAIAAGEGKSIKASGLHASSFAILAVLSGWRTIANTYSGFEFGSVPHLIKGAGQLPLFLLSCAGVGGAVAAPFAADYAGRGVERVRSLLTALRGSYNNN